jgi:hypothetical protein
MDFSPSPSTSISTFPSMDKEHEKCEEALSLLLSAPNAKTLTNCMEALTEHFQHEEILMEANDFGKPNEKFSPYTNHCKDHERILDMGFRELGKHSKQTSSLLDSSFLAITCSDVSDESGCSSGKNGAWHIPAVDKVDRSIAESIVREFRLHASRFDMLYEGKLQE